MKNNNNVQFLCNDCENYNRCEYYYGRLKSSYICKYFHLPKERLKTATNHLKNENERSENDE